MAKIAALRSVFAPKNSPKCFAAGAPPRFLMGEFT